MGGLSCGVVRQAMLGESRCGDAYAVIDRERYALVVAVDGLGHGPEAEEVALRAIAFVESHAEMAPARLVEACHLALRGSRGAVLAIARIERESQELRYSALGNIDTRIVAADRTYRPLGMRGIVGLHAQKFTTETFPFHPGDLLVMHSDGISDRFEITAAARCRDLQMFASELAYTHGKHNDDQLLLIVREDA